MPVCLVADSLGRRPLLFNSRAVHDVAQHGLLELDLFAVVDEALIHAAAAAWIEPLGHAPGLHEGGPFLVLNGVSANGATLAEQSYGVLRSVDAQLRAVGSGIENLVKMNVYIADFDSYPQFNNVTRELFAHFIPPTRSVIGAPAVTGTALLRIDCVALRAV